MKTIKATSVVGRTQERINCLVDEAPNKATRLGETMRQAADTMIKLNTIAIAARAFADSMICLDKECIHKKCVLNRAFAELDKGE